MFHILKFQSVFLTLQMSYFEFGNYGKFHLWNEIDFFAKIVDLSENKNEKKIAVTYAQIS